MNELGLFAGAGGGLLATQHLLGHRTVCYVEREPKCVEVLKARIRDGLLCDAPIWDDVWTFAGRPWRGVVDLVSAGFPCQPFSIAGKRKADLDARNMWSATIRIIRDVRPEWCLLENVPGLLRVRRRFVYRMVRDGRLVAAYQDTLVFPSYFGRILSDLADSGFDVAWKVLSAAEVGAPHKRDRLWLVCRNADCLQHDSQPQVRGGQPADAGGNGDGVADTHGSVTGRLHRRAGPTHPITSISGADVSDTTSIGGSGRRQCGRIEFPQGGGGGGNVDCWSVEPELGRVADGVANRVDRLRAIGNGQVPAVAALAWRRLTGEMEPPMNSDEHG